MARIKSINGAKNAFNDEISYMSLFPDTEFNNLTEAYSVYGAGAYFVALMNIATNKTYISGEPAGLSLKGRRPDLWNLEVTQANIDNEVPYLEKVYDLLDSYLKGKKYEHILQNIAEGKTSFIPYNHPVRQINAGLKAYGTSFDALAPYFCKYSKEDLTIVMAELGLSQYEVDILKKPETKIDSWNFPKKATDPYTTPEKFRIFTGLDMDAMLLLVNNNISSNDKNALGNLFINLNEKTEPLQYKAYDGKKEESFINLDETRLKRIRIFLTLANATGWDFTSLNAVLVADGIWDDKNIDESLTRVAKISYMSKLLQLSPVSIVPVNYVNNNVYSNNTVQLLQSGVMQKNTAVDTADNNALINTLNLAEGISKITASDLSSPNQNALNLLIPLTNKLGITIQQFEVYKIYHNITVFKLDDLFNLVNLNVKLRESGVSMNDYVTLLATVLHYDALDVKFEEWLRSVRDKLDETEASNTEPKKPKTQAVALPDPAEAHLQMLLFQQWTHELAVYWGEKDSSIYNVMSGLSHRLNDEKIIGLDGVKKLNEFIRGGEYDKVKTFIKSLYPYITLVNMLPIDDRAGQYVSSYLIPFSSPFNVSAFSDANALVVLQFNHVYNQIAPNQQAAYLEYLSRHKEYSKKDLEENLPVYTNWPKASITAFLNDWYPESPVKKSKKESKIAYTINDVVSIIQKLSYCYAASVTCSLNTDTLSNMLACIKSKSDWPELEKKSKDFIKSISNADNSSISAAYETQKQNLLETVRDRLVPVVLWHLNEAYTDINTPDHLSDYFLCDVEMSGIMNISKLREATDAVQTYLMRCKAGLEQIDLKSLKNITAQQWQWIPNFRVWQAEQMLRTYPENYLQPTVRSTSTDQFKELISNITQNELTQNSAETALLNYLDEWVDMENAEIVDASCYNTFSPLFDKEVETLFLISKSAVKEHTFNFAYKETDTVTGVYNWYPWQEIGATINADTVSGIYAFNRLHIIWSEQTSISDTDPTVQNGKYTLYYQEIKVVYQNIDGTWSAPKSITKFPFYIDVQSGSTLVTWGGTSNKIAPEVTKEFNINNASWKKVGVVEAIWGKTHYLQLFYGPSRHVNTEFNFEIKISEKVNDTKLKEFAGFINSNYSNRAEKGESDDITFDIVPIILNKSLDTIGLSGVVSKYYFKKKACSDSIRPLYEINTTTIPLSTHRNIYLHKYDEFISENYRDTTEYLNLGVDDGSPTIFSKDLNYPNQKVIGVRNKPGAFYLSLHNVGYLFNTIYNCLNQATITLMPDGKSFYTESSIKSEYNFSNYNIERVNQYAINQLRTDAHSNGLQFLNRNTQINNIGNPETKFKDLAPDSKYITNPDEDSDNKIDFYGAYGIYARELFFHAPMAVGNLLGNSMQYDEARAWYHYIYNSLGVTNANKRDVWQYEPFFQGGRVESVKKNENNEIVVMFFSGVEKNTFYKSIYEPYIAYSERLNIYAIAVRSDKEYSIDVIYSTDNGKKWSRETVSFDKKSIPHKYGIEVKNNQFVLYNLYMKCYLKTSSDLKNWSEEQEAEKIDVPKSAQLQKVIYTTVDSFDPDIIAQNDIQIYKKWSLLQYIQFVINFADNEYTQETWESLSLATQLYFEAEDLLGQEPQIQDLVTAYNKQDRAYSKIGSKISDYFGVPTNTGLSALWDTVKNRLYNLRNGLNINGERQMPSLYGTSIDPAKLLIASKNGGINPYNPSAITVTKTIYRFRDLAPHTESMINLVVEFGGLLYNALIQKDNEQLQVLQATHQINMLNVINNVYQRQIEEANSELAVLNTNLSAAKGQITYYEGLIEQGVTANEEKVKALNRWSAFLLESAAASSIAAGVANTFPNIFGLANGGSRWGGIPEGIAGSTSNTAFALGNYAQNQAMFAEHFRRAEEWEFQKKQAELNASSITKSIEAATLRLIIAKENMKQYNLQVNQANEVLNYLTGKFTNAELYNWVANKMSSLYFTAYQLAFSSLHKLQAAYNYEIDSAGTTVEFIPTNSWNSLRKGLLAGETLKLALARMQDAYFTNNERRQEVESIISLKNLNGAGFIFINDELKFKLNAEVLYKKGSTVKIKSIAVSIPAVVGPYETFKATLKNLETGEQITISRGIEDMGVFVDEMNDGRYLPFEGIKINDTDTDWTLKIPGASKKNVSDVILNIRFTVK